MRCSRGLPFHSTTAPPTSDGLRFYDRLYDQLWAVLPVVSLQSVITDCKVRVVLRLWRHFAQRRHTYERSKENQYKLLPPTPVSATSFSRGRLSHRRGAYTRYLFFQRMDAELHHIETQNVILCKNRDVLMTIHILRSFFPNLFRE